MTPEWFYIFAGALALSVAGFIFVAMSWLRKLRDTVASAMTEAAGQQIRTAQRHGESIAELQKQQDACTRQIHILAQAGLRLQQELAQVSSRVEAAQSETPPPGPQTLH